MSNTGIFVRFEPEVLEVLRERAGQSTEHSGRSGGLALYIRRLVYEHQGLEMPVQFGDKNPELNERRRKEKQAEPRKKRSREEPRGLRETGR